MTKKNERPEIVTDEHLVYLDDLRESGITNMYGAGAYIIDEFSMSASDSNVIVGYWMDTFGERHG